MIKLSEHIVLVNGNYPFQNIVRNIEYINLMLIGFFATNVQLPLNHDQCIRTQALKSVWIIKELCSLYSYENATPGTCVI